MNPAAREQIEKYWTELWARRNQWNRTGVSRRSHRWQALLLPPAKIRRRQIHM